MTQPVNEPFVWEKYRQGRSVEAVGVVIRSLNKSFGDNLVLRDLNLEVTPGETLVILGKSGTGKSVLLRHIIGLMKPDSGAVTVGEIDVEDQEFRKKHTLAIVFQSAALFNSLSVGDNVALYLREHRIYGEEEIRDVVRETLTVVGLEGKEDVMPSELSGGMKKRVAIARALAMSPELILYDEPTGELDPMMTHTIGDEILKLRKRFVVTQIVVTHDVYLAFYVADRIAVLDEGSIIEIGAPEKLRRSTNSITRDFLRSL
ncbi:MAG: ATP-binding cassette domain-containing protein [Candidatus Dadabacteria bacterium]|nr:ATP-binding cassette domain-containing protein [Candidatus Dadabacteria bacterium]